MRRWKKNEHRDYRELAANARLPFVSIIIPVRNGEKHLAACLQSLLSQEYPPVNIEIIVVDDHSTDRTVELIRTFPVRCAQSSHRNPASARNVGMSIARGEILLFIDSDCIAPENLVLRHVRRHLYFQEHDPAVMAVGGGIFGINKNIWAVCDDLCSWFDCHPRLPARYEKSHCSTANFSITRAVVNTVGYFNEQLDYAEDYEYCRRILAQGIKIYFEPKAAVGHTNRSNSRGFLLHAKEWWTGSLSILLANKIVKPEPAAVPFILFGSFYFMLKIIVCGIVVHRYYSIFLFPLIYLSQLLRSIEQIKIILLYKKEVKKIKKRRGMSSPIADRNQNYKNDL
jgi:glycosyltransferase involved in cell wall biosynthesis